MKVSKGFLPIRIHLLNVREQYIRDLPGCVRNGKLGSGSGLLAVANISDQCTSGVVPKSDIQDFSLKVRKVLEQDVRVRAAIGCRRSKGDKNSAPPLNRTIDAGWRATDHKLHLWADTKSLRW